MIAEMIFTPPETPVAVDPDVQWTRDRLAVIDAEVAGLREIETKLREAEAKKSACQAAADDMGAAVAQQTYERLRKGSDPAEIGRLSAERGAIVNDFIRGGANEHRLKVLDRAIHDLQQALMPHKTKLESLESSVSIAEQRVSQARRPAEERQAVAGVEEAKERVKFWGDVLEVMREPITRAQKEIESIRAARRAVLHGD